MMPYNAQISRANPTCFVFLVDQSASMKDPIGGEGLRKCHVVADALNRLLSELTIRCAREESVRDYFHVGVIGYGLEVLPVLGGELAGRDLAPISQVAEWPARVEERTRLMPDGTGGLVEQTVKFPVWVDPAAQGGTPMCHALERATDILADWLEEHPGCHPPSRAQPHRWGSDRRGPSLPRHGAAGAGQRGRERAAVRSARVTRSQPSDPVPRLPGGAPERVRSAALRDLQRVPRQDAEDGP